MKKIYTREEKIFLKKLGKNVLEARKNASHSQEGLALKSDISVEHLGNIERGKTNSTLAILIKIADTLSMDIAKFFENVD